MNALHQLVLAAGDLGSALLHLFLAAFSLVYAVWPPLLWVLFFLFVVRWPDFREQLRKGAWVPFALLVVIVSLTWGLMSEPYYIAVPSILEKFVIMGLFVAIAFLCGHLQDRLGLTPAEAEYSGPPEPVGGAAHGAHGGHGGHHAPSGHH